MTLVPRPREQARPRLLHHYPGTSAAGAMRETEHRRSVVEVSRFEVSRFVVTENTPYWKAPFNFGVSGTTSFVPNSEPMPDANAARAETNEATRTALMELRRLSGLTWNQLAQLLGVSRRSVHLWASGKPLSAYNEERLHRLLALLKQLDRGSADDNRRLLLTPLDQQGSPVELLATGKLEEVRNRLGPGLGVRKTERTPLAALAWEARLPPKPEQLVDALQDSIHREPDNVRGARSKRVDKETKG